MGSASIAGRSGVALAGLAALQALGISLAYHPERRRLIHGASGGVGVYAIQIARRLGAEVTTITSAVNRDLARTLGATEALAYDLGEKPAAHLHAVFDVSGTSRAARPRRGSYRGRLGQGPCPRRALWRDALSGVVRSASAWWWCGREQANLKSGGLVGPG